MSGKTRDLRVTFTIFIFISINLIPTKRLKFYQYLDTFGKIRSKMERKFSQIKRIRKFVRE